MSRYAHRWQIDGIRDGVAASVDRVRGKHRMILIVGSASENPAHTEPVIRDVIASLALQGWKTPTARLIDVRRTKDRTAV